MIYKIIAVYLMAYYLVWFMVMLRNIYFVLLTQLRHSWQNKNGDSFTPIGANVYPFISLLESWEEFKVEIKQWCFAGFIGSLINIILGNFG